MEEELNKIIEIVKKKYKVEELVQNIVNKKGYCLPLFLVIHDDGSEYIQESEDEYDFCGLYSERARFFLLV